MTSTVLITGARTPGAAHAARLCREGGLTVYAADCLDNPLTRRAPYVHLSLRHPSPRRDYTGFRDWLAHAVHKHRIDIIFPACEEVFHLARACKELGLSKKLFAPDLDILLAHHDKYAFTETMRRIDMPAPETRLLRSPAALDSVAGSAHNLVFKPALSRFSSRVIIRPRKERLAAVKPSPATPWVAQEALPGSEICIYLVARRGQVGALSAYRPLHLSGPGAAICFAPVMDSRIEAFARSFAARANWTGQAAFDCIDTPDRGLVAIECNPRATSGIFLFEDGPSFVAAIRGTGRATPIDEARQFLPSMLTHGLLAALRNGRVASWAADIRQAGSATAYGGAGPLSTTACIAEIAMLALRHKLTLAEAATFDLDWEVEPSRYV